MEAASEPIETADAEAEEPRLGIGDYVEFAQMGLKVLSADKVDEIKTTEGAPITPGDGEDLILVKEEFTELSSSGTDLSCGSPDAYIQMWDDSGFEMQPVFDTYRIPGNPECNTWLLTGQTHDWNTAWRIVEGHNPHAISISDTDTWEYVVIYLDDGGPEIVLD